jgi:hypothetical protein
VAEDFGELHEDFSSLTPLEMAEFCVEGVREASCFVAVLTERWGSEINVDGIGNVPTSFLEIELMEAALLERGTDLMKDDPRPGFAIRAIRKLAVGYARSLDLRRALDYAVIAYDKAVETGAYDQISRLERIAKRIARLRRR